MKRHLKAHWIVPCVALLAISSLQAADEKPVAEAGQARFQDSGQAKPISNAAPDRSVNTSRAERL